MNDIDMLVCAVCAVERCANVHVDKALSVSLSYWLQRSLDTVDDLFTGQHWELINAIVPVYDRFLHHGTCLNRTLREEFEVFVVCIH